MLVRIAVFVLISIGSLFAQDRWQLDPDGGITWTVKPADVHQDHVEMSGRRVSVIVTYGVDNDGQLVLTRHIVFPRMRQVPNKTGSHLDYVMGQDATPRIFVDGLPVRVERIESFHHRGLLQIDSYLSLDRRGREKTLTLTRTVFPSVDKQLVVERWKLSNTSTKAHTVEVEQFEKTVRTAAARGVNGSYLIEARTPDGGLRTLEPGASTTFSVLFDSREANEPPLVVDAEREETARRNRVDQIFNELQVETPDPVLNTLFQFSKLRTTESIYDTRGGLMHGPGGGAYYAAIWANDTIEYTTPFFAYLGDPTGAESAINAYRLYARYMNPEYKPIPSSIIAEGTGTWHGAGDRGDMAMLAYGGARFSLAYGDKKTAEEIWPLIEWSLEYCRRKITSDGVVASDSDELENRFPAGKANLNTSSIYYDALNSAVYLGRALGKPEAQLKQYAEGAKQMRAAIERYFGATVEGYNTYRYYDGNTVLRAWTSTPLCMGLLDRKDGVVDALFSSRLWTPDGLATQAGDKTFWDRSTLYALRGVFAAGATEKGLDKLSYYSRRRLLGEHVPYAIEAWPEGNQRHLAAEGALYARIYTEGIFGIRPTGFRSFTMTPQLPAAWDSMKLRHVHGFGKVFDVAVTKTNGGVRVEVTGDGVRFQSRVVAPGSSIDVNLGQ